MQQRSRGGFGLTLALLSAATFGTSGSFAASLIEAGWTPPSTAAAREAIPAARQDQAETERAGKEDPQIITVHQCEAGSDRILNTWLLHGCRPVRWSGPEFNALSGDLLWEEIEVSWERLEWR